MEIFYSCEQVANRYGVKVTTVWEWIKAQKLPAVKIGKSYRIKEADLDAFEQRNMTTQASQ